MALVRVTALKNFLGTPLSTSDNSTGSIYSTVAPVSGQRIYAGLALTAASTGRTLVFTVQSASSSGFGTLTTEISFSLTSQIGSTWQSAASPSTDRPWRRAKWVLSTASSTAGAWSGICVMGFR